jgi:hypothetical protein
MSQGMDGRLHVLFLSSPQLVTSGHPHKTDNISVVLMIDYPNNRLLFGSEDNRSRFRNADQYIG